MEVNRGHPHHILCFITFRGIEPTDEPIMIPNSNEVLCNGDYAVCHRTIRKSLEDSCRNYRYYKNKWKRRHVNANCSVVKWDTLETAQSVAADALEARQLEKDKVIRVKAAAQAKHRRGGHRRKKIVKTAVKEKAAVKKKAQVYAYPKKTDVLTFLVPVEQLSGAMLAVPDGAAELPHSWLFIEQRERWANLFRKRMTDDVSDDDSYDTGEE